jgi:hypothetical protein
MSNDAGASWLATTEETTGNNIDFLGGQGWYDNTILAHPFNINEVYVGGVNLWKFEIKQGTVTKKQFLGAEEQDTKSFMSLINFGTAYYDGKIDIGNEPIADFVTVEVRFGPDGNGGHLKQKAHRFTIPVGQGSGVPAADYTYQDYVEVPFQVWDIINNRQLMISFRDQQEDEIFNLLSSNTDNADAVNNSREYIFISSITYNASLPDSAIALNGGHEYKNLYFFWPYLTENAVWDETALPDSKFIIKYEDIEKGLKITSTVSDAYGEFTGANKFFQSTGSSAPQGLHPDHHNIVPILWNTSMNSFQLLVANDGGIYKSDISENPGEEDESWELAGISYNTSQFYAVDKAPGENRYIGGMQDNGSWMTKPGDEGSATAFYRRSNSGDGFGTAWNHRNPAEIITTVYNNDIVKSMDGGASFRQSVNGLTDTGGDKAPFKTEIENLHSDPEVVYTVGISGVWRSEDFADSWQLSSIESPWTLASNMRVRISHANSQIVWAGIAMQETPSSLSLYVSTDDGKTFNSTNNYTDVELGKISGLATHPILDSTAFALFSFAKGPKILRTDNLGVSWYDISGFGTDTISVNGFPDVAIYDLMVMPYDTAILWAGTEIGIFESSNSGASWHILNANMPAASIWDLKIVDKQVVIGTHGRGIWSTTIDELPGQVYIPVITGTTPSLSGDLAFNVNTYSPFDSIHIFVDGVLVAKHNQPSEAGIVEIATNYNTSQSGKVYARAYYRGGPYVSHNFNFATSNYTTVVDSYENDFNVMSSDFFGNGFIEKNEPDFMSRAIHSEHFHIPGAYYQYILKSPIRVRSANALINFQEVVLIEPGDEGALPGTAEFNDYVVVQGSKDGVNWINLVDEYDANSRNDWRESYAIGEAGFHDLYKFRGIDLLKTFAPNDEIIIRFVLVANLKEEGWGWAIDGLKIQTDNVITGVSEELGLGISLYPNPVLGNEMNVSAPENIKTLTVSMYDLNGRITLQKSINLAENTNISIPSDIKDGLYSVVLSAKDLRVSQKILIQRNK